jgi:Flp pilus assembly protein TadG
MLRTADTHGPDRAERRRRAHTPAARVRRRSRGATMTEAALILPTLLLITFALLDFTFLLHAHLALANGVSEATRWAVTGQTLPDPDHNGQSLSRAASIIATVKKSTPSLAIQDSDVKFHNMTTNTDDAGGPDDVIRVTVTYNWALLTPVIRPFFKNGEITLQASSTMKNEPYPGS